VVAVFADDAVCDSSKGVEYKAYPGTPQTAVGNLGQAFAFCPSSTLQVCIVTDTTFLGYRGGGGGGGHPPAGHTQRT
jgi:hypothetical protein